MDLAIGARQTFVMMDLLTRGGDSKLVTRCTCPLTGLACVSRVYTDHGTFAVGAGGASVIDMADGVTLDMLRDITGLELGMAMTAATH